MFKIVLPLLFCGLAMTAFALRPDTASRTLPMIVAHRGASFDAPENTLASFKLAWEQGADAIEGDFYLSADGQIITLHDSTFKRTAGVEKKPIELTLEEIQRLDVGSWKGAKFAGERVPTLGEILAVLPDGKRFLIEIKCGPEILPTLKQTIESSGVAVDQLRLIAFDANVVAESKKLMPGLTAYWLTGFKAQEGQTQKHPTTQEVLNTLKRIGADGVDARADMDVVDEAFVRAMTDAGFEVHFWTVDDPGVARRLHELGAQSITTNRPAMIRESLSK